MTFFSVDTIESTAMYCHNDTEHVVKLAFSLVELENFLYIYSETNICRRRSTDCSHYSQRDKYRLVYIVVSLAYL